LPDEKPQFENYIGIDEDMVEDINGNLFDNHQSIRDIVHNIPSILIKTVKTGGDRVFENVLSVLEIQLTPIKEILLRIKPDIDFLKIENSIKKEVKEIIDKKDFKAENLYDFIDSSVFTKLIPKDENEDNPVWIKRRWQVLFIDDELETRNTVVELFRIKEIFCHPADSAQDAFEILKKDSQNANLISVIISDYRLYLNGDSNFDLWQDLQGPQILKQIHYNPDFKKHYAYVILTQKSSKIRNQISKSHKFYILYFNKKDVLADVNHGFNIFCQRIIEIGSEAFLRKFDTPDSAVWTHGSDRVKPGLSFYYRLHVESFDYEQAEKDIITVSLAEIENIKKNISLNANYEYQCSLILESSYRNENELLKKFRKNILIPRRIIWYFLNGKIKNADEIFELFDDSKQENDKDNIEKNKLRRKKALYNKSLGISIKMDEWIKDPKKVFNPGILFEERKFIEKYTESHVEIKGSFIACQNDYSILRNFFIDIGETEILLINSTLKAYNILFNDRQKQVDINLISKSVEEIKGKIRNNESLKIILHNSLIDFYKNPLRYENLNNQKLKEILKKSNFE